MTQFKMKLEGLEHSMLEIQALVSAKMNKMGVYYYQIAEIEEDEENEITKVLIDIQGWSEPPHEQPEEQTPEEEEKPEEEEDW